MIVRNKINRKTGFSLTELLAAVLILGMVSSVVAGGIPVARDAYNKVTVSANAQVLMSTTISALRSQLGVGKIDSVGVDGKSIKYLNGKNGANSEISLSDGKLMIQEYVDVDDLKKPLKKPDMRQLVPGTDGLYATCTRISSDPNDDNLITFKDLTVKKTGETKDYVTPIDVSIRVIGN